LTARAATAVITSFFIGSVQVVRESRSALPIVKNRSTEEPSGGIIAAGHPAAVNLSRVSELRWPVHDVVDGELAPIAACATGIVATVGLRLAKAVEDGHRLPFTLPFLHCVIPGYDPRTIFPPRVSTVIQIV